MHKIMDKFAIAARANAYQVQVKEAERDVSAAEKEQDKLNRSIQSAQSNTAANLKRIDELTNKNRSNALQMHQDSLQLVTNAQLPLATLRQLKEMLDAGALTPQEFEALKQKLIFGQEAPASATEPPQAEPT
nr:hypothetical protein [Tanacetum cinerariifolium]